MAAAPELRIHRSFTKSLKLFDHDRLRWLDEAAAAGPLTALRLGPVRAWVITDPDVTRTMLVTDSASWTRPPTLVTPIRLGVGENLFTQRDKAWTALQPALAPSFRRRSLDNRLAGIGALVDDEVGALPLDTPIDFELAMGRIALILAAWVLLGERLEPARADEIAHHQREVVRWVGRRVGELGGVLPLAWGKRGRAMRRHRAVLNTFADDVVARATTGRRGDDDVLGALLAARPAGKRLRSTALRGHVLGLFLAGNETTAAALSWALVHGAHAPDEWARVRDDPAAHTTAFLDETLRLTPPVWGTSRTPTRAGTTLTAGDVTARVRRGQVATVYLRGIHRDPQIWDDPLRFDPSRHDAAAKGSQRSLLPFGLGPRGCIGQHLAMAEMTAVLPALARHGNIVVDGTVTEDPAFALRVRGDLRGRFTRKTPAAPAQPSGNRARSV